MSYKQIHITAKPGHLGEVLDDDSEYNQTVAEETRVAMAGPAMKVALQAILDVVPKNSPAYLIASAALQKA